MKRVYLVIILGFVGLIVAMQLLKHDPVKDLLSSLSPEQKGKAIFALDDPKKQDWHFFPSTMFNREGLPLKEMNAKQKKLAHSVLKSMLSKSGYEKTLEIMELENVLRSMGQDTVMRDPGKYFMSFYGDPINEDLWSMSFEGHHLSLNFTVSGEKVVASPRFFGANPAMIPEGPRKGDRTLATEEDLGFELINALDASQQQKAIFQTESFKDIVSGNLPEIDPMKPVGINYSELKPDQQKQLIGIIDLYLSNMPSKIASERRQKVMDEDLSDLYFGWVGAKALGSAHYYRIQAKTFLIEFDNSQNNSNHIHTVWRDFESDFGRDLIREHMAKAHSH
ncbi:DUF3500 domain-containing protein [Algoriphagus yeomjeoni]|uniref:DUF3500 domain-containing protein n=1 Tax=Algoriphagus yeomjeoni TaxID=291403 RepID=UPI003CE4C183